jgi:hypothetical protein
LRPKPAPISPRLEVTSCGGDVSKVINSHPLREHYVMFVEGTTTNSENTGEGKMHGETHVT